MSVLDDLKREAEKLQDEKQQAMDNSAHLEKVYGVKFKSRMVGIARYLHQLVNQLKEAKMEVPVTYIIPEIGPVELRQKGYVISADNMDEPRKIGLQVDCIAKDVQEWQINQLDKVSKVIDFLDSKGIEYTEWSVRDSARKVTGRVFKMQVKVRVWFIFEVDVKKERLHVKIINYDFDAEKNMYFKPAEITKEWLNLLAKYILRKSSEFGSLEIMDMDVSIIQTQMMEAEMLRKLELELAERKKEGMFGKLMDTLNKPIF